MSNKLMSVMGELLDDNTVDNITIDSGAFGQQYGTTYGFPAGGFWSASSYCGSHCRDSTSVLSRTNATIGGRGSAGVSRIA